jgi:hypothetical protein
MTSVPDSSTVMVLDPDCAMGAPFLNQLMVGRGLPDAWHGRMAIVLMGSVWSQFDESVSAVIYRFTGNA